MAAPAQILFDKFEVVECLKKDNFSTVYLANHIFLAKKILLKTLSRHDLKDPVWLERFKREAKILARLDHPNVIRVLDFGSNRDEFYISFEYFESLTLRELLHQKKLTGIEKLHLFDQLLHGLAAAHRNGIVHRDIKPENILVNTQHQLKIADFGLAITTEENLLTAKSSIVGTPAYMSPEQIRGEKLTARSDLFSLGILAFEMFCGYNPFLGAEINITINNILNPAYDHLARNIDQHVPEIGQIIKKLLRFEGTTQPVSAEDLLAPADAQSGSRPGKRSRPVRRKITYFITGILILVIVSLIYFYLSGRQNIIPPAGDTYPPATSEDMIDSVPAATATDPHPPAEHNPERNETPVMAFGYLLARSDPASELWIDGQDHGLIPSGQLLKLSAGFHALSMRHDLYPEYKHMIEITAEETLDVVVRLDTLYGYYTCEAYPWGTVYLEGKYQGDTPLLEPIRYPPGSYALIIENPDFPLYHDTMTVSRNETTRVRINLESIKP